MELDFEGVIEESSIQQQHILPTNWVKVMIDKLIECPISLYR